MESFSFINNDDKIEFKILRAKQSDEFDNGYHFVSQLLLSKKNIYIRFEEIELNLRFFNSWHKSLLHVNKKNVSSSLDGKLKVIIERSTKQTLIKLEYNEVDFEETLDFELNLDQFKIIDLKNQLEHFISSYKNIAN
ncbi:MULTISPECIES: hypothetical protein [Bacillus]|uniref:hypothetical protein n=1 Tax=Bacillus TaxID=1386 RepID=UPI00057F673E|nr:MULTISPECIES: hypothetical protein [Bacillus]AIZ60918.1 hypothetical protein QR42_11790 [Bacillus sp. WP8]MCM3137181.1 hypothetical protein [Bacillus safensis]UXC31242.1 hypothetical protein N4Q31_12110 [Bacillus safensis]